MSESIFVKKKSFDDTFFLSYANNNGVDKDSAEMHRLVSIRPSNRQIIYSDMLYYNFIHFGINTFTNREWGKGNENPLLFAPTTLDTDQWAEVLAKSGSKGVIFTAKHHDGFCLWQTDTTEHSIKNSHYKNGKGDIVKELADSCKKFNLKLGLYLSPWDRNCPLYGRDSYNDFFVKQLTELCTRYGEIFSFWFDGACGEKSTLDANFKYDFERYYAVIRKYQPNAVIAICGPDVRWVGNEGGVSRDSEWCVVPEFVSDTQAIAERSQQDENHAVKGKKIISDCKREDLGSRNFLKNYNRLVWYPAEVDVSIRKGWFYHKNQRPKSSKKLVKIYYSSVGGNASLLLNVPPNKDGLIDARDVKVLEEFSRVITNDFSREISYKAFAIGKTKRPILDEIISSLDAKSIPFNKDEYYVDCELGCLHRVKKILLKEDIREGERIELFDVYSRNSRGKWTLIAKGTTVGMNRILNVKKCKTDAIRIAFKQSRLSPVLRTIKIYE